MVLINKFSGNTDNDDPPSSRFCLTGQICVSANVFNRFQKLGVLMTNGFENDHQGAAGRALYPTLSLTSHSCKANLRHAISPGKQVALQAQVFIRKGIWKLRFDIVYCKYRLEILM